MEALQSFIKEVDSSKSSDGASASASSSSSSSSATADTTTEVASVPPEPIGGKLLLIGCNDWEAMTTSKPAGLEVPHLIDLGAPVLKTFSSSSSMHCFILLADGRLFSMGRNDHGQLGLGDKTTRTYPVEVKSKALPVDASIVKIATGRSHTLILLDNGDIYGVGSGNFGQLGRGDNKSSKEDSLVLVKVPLEDVVDIAAGPDHSLACTKEGYAYSWGHPEYGQLGFGTNGEYIREGGKGAALQYSCVTTPRRIDRLLCKDNHGKVTAEYTCSDIRVRAVAAGKNHSLFLEDWENGSSNRVFSCGWGGYGRLGHNCAEDELFPREINSLTTPPGRPVNNQRAVRQIVGGSSFSLAVSAGGNLLFWGKMSNSPRGEAQTYPKNEDDLYGLPITHLGAGSNLIMASTSGNICVGWGVPVAGKIGLKDNAKSSTKPQYASLYDTLTVLDLSCGYGHACLVVEDNEAWEAKVESFPLFESTMSEEDSSAAAVKGKGKGKAAAGTKRGAKVGGDEGGKAKKAKGAAKR